MNRLFVLALEKNTFRTYYTRYFLPTVEIKHYNGVISEQNFFDQSVKNDLRIYNNIRKRATGQGDDYTNGCLLDYPYVKEYYKLIAIDFRNHQALDTDLKRTKKLILLDI